MGRCGHIGQLKRLGEISIRLERDRIDARQSFAVEASVEREGAPVPLEAPSSTSRPTMGRGAQSLHVRGPFMVTSHYGMAT